MNLCLKLRSNRQTYIVEAVWAAEVSSSKENSRKIRGDHKPCGSCTQIGNSIMTEVTVRFINLRSWVRELNRNDLFF